MNIAFVTALLLLGVLGAVGAAMLWPRLAVAVAGQVVMKSSLAWPAAVLRMLQGGWNALGKRTRALFGGRDLQPRVLLIGASGSGKSSLLASLMAACAAHSGPSPAPRGSVPGAQLASVYLLAHGAQAEPPSGAAPSAWLVDPEPGVGVVSPAPGAECCMAWRHCAPLAHWTQWCWCFRCVRC